MPLYKLDGVAPTLPPGGRVYIADGARLMGDVRLGEDASVWFNAVLRGDNEPMQIGARTNIQDGAVLHSDPGAPLTIGSDCTIGHAAILHGCTVGNGSLVGMGATILNRAVIGEGSLVGANALVTEGKVFPERALIVGAPAKMIRQLTDEEVARLIVSAAHYVANGKRFAAGLSPIDETATTA
jgi:carbonic anhydrase/acetyltransferase-like protein (isoleucine patch superfamily)